MVHIIINFVIWQAPRAGSVRPILCSDWLPEQARWAILPTRDRPFCPANKILPKCKQVHETFRSLKLLSAKVKRFFVLSVSLWNQKTGKPKASMRMKKKKTKMLICLKNMFCKKQVRRSFFFSALYAM